jgi:hypothetical protein
MSPPYLADVIREAVHYAEIGLVQEAIDLLRTHVDCAQRPHWGRRSTQTPLQAPKPTPPRVA